MARDGAATEYAKGLWGWTARNPEWHPGDWGAEVRSWAARAGNDLLLLDPQLPVPGEDREAVLETLDSEAGRAERVAIIVSVGYHARSTEELWDRYRGDTPVSVHGHKAVAKRLGKRVARDFSEIEPGAEMPGGAVAHRIGKPRRQETPVHLPSHDALLFGDAVVTTPQGKVRSWAHDPVDAKVKAFYRERFNPTLKPLTELGVERLLMTHGEPVLERGTEKLRGCIRADPWYHAG